MKILILQSDGKHEANRLFREASCLRRSFQRIGISAECWGPGYPQYQYSFEYASRDADVILVTENYDRTGWLPNLSACGILKIFWSIDAHVVLRRHIDYVHKNRIDVVLSSTERYLKNFSADKKYWFPNCYPDDLFDTYIETIGTVAKTQDIGFCGNINNRGGWLEMLGIKPDVMVLGEKMIRKIAGYKIHWNRGVRDDINYRVFETLGIGTFLLTNRVHGLDRLLIDGRHLATYSNGAECIEKMAYYIKNESEREKIAAAGRAHVKRNHTYDVRAQQLKNIIKECA